MTSVARPRALLIQPYNRFCIFQNVHTPTHLFRLAAVARGQAQCDAYVLDIAQSHGVGLSADADRVVAAKVAAPILDEHWDLVGISLTSCAQYPFARQLLDELRCRRCPGAPPLLVVGGYHATIGHAFLLKHDGADVVVLGDGEDALLGLLRTTQHCGVSLSDVPNLAYRDSGGIVRTRRVVSQPAYASVVAEPKSLLHEAEYGTWVAFHSLGCSYGCAFCLEQHMRGRALRVADPAISAAELLTGTAHFAIQDVYVGDPIIGLAGGQHQAYFSEVAHLSEICGMPLRIGAMLRADSPERLLGPMLDAFCRSGGYDIWVGLEHVDEQILLHDLRKTRNPASYLRSFERTLRSLRERGIIVTVGLILGSPGESTASLERVRAFCSRFFGQAQFYAQFYKPYEADGNPEECDSGDARPWWTDERALANVMTHGLPTALPCALSDEELLDWKTRFNAAAGRRTSQNAARQSPPRDAAACVHHGILNFRRLMRMLRPALDRTRTWTGRAELMEAAIGTAQREEVLDVVPTTGGRQ